MLMTVLRRELATAQSKALTRIFKGMKDYISENRALIGTDDIARLAIQTVKIRSRTGSGRHVKKCRVYGINCTFDYKELKVLFYARNRQYGEGTYIFGIVAFNILGKS